MKTCIKCNTPKPLDEFSKSRTSHKGTCKACIKEYSKNWREKKEGMIDGLFNVDKEMSYLCDLTPNHINSGLQQLQRERIDHVHSVQNKQFKKTA
jgi:hypothetical protein